MTRFEKIKEILDCLEEVTMKKVEKKCKLCKNLLSCSTLTQAIFGLKDDYDS